MAITEKFTAASRSLKKYKKDKIINYNEKFGMLFTTTEIFYC